MHECASGDECGCNQGDVCTSLGVSCSQEGSPLPLTPSSEGGRRTSGWAANGGLQLQTRGCSLPWAKSPSTAQNAPSPAELAVGLISGLWLGRPRILVQAGWRRGRGQPPQGPQISTRRKEGPVGMGAQDKKGLTWPCLVQEAAQRPLAWPGQKTTQGSHPSRMGGVSPGLPFPGSIICWLRQRVCGGRGT